MELQSSTTHNANELATEARDLRDSLAVRTANKGNGGMRAVATFGRPNMKGSTFFYEDVISSHGYVFRAISVVCKYYPTYEKAREIQVCASKNVYTKLSLRLVWI